MDDRRNILLRMPDGGQAGYIEAWFQGDDSHIEFRGLPYTMWHAPEPEPGNWFRRIHDALEGWHSTVLHQQQTLMLHPRHPDYDAVYNLMMEAENGTDQ